MHSVEFSGYTTSGGKTLCNNVPLAPFSHLLPTSNLNMRKATEQTIMSTPTAQQDLSSFFTACENESTATRGRSSPDFYPTTPRSFLTPRNAQVPRKRGLEDIHYICVDDGSDDSNSSVTLPSFPELIDQPVLQPRNVNHSPERFKRPRLISVGSTEELSRLFEPIRLFDTATATASSSDEESSTGSSTRRVERADKHDAQHLLKPQALRPQRLL